MAWSDHIDTRPQYWGAPDLIDGHSRVGEAMGGLADDDCAHPLTAPALAGRLEDHDRVHEAMCGICAADDT